MTALEKIVLEFSLLSREEIEQRTAEIRAETFQQAGDGRSRDEGYRPQPAD